MLTRPPAGVGLRPDVVFCVKAVERTHHATQEAAASSKSRSTCGRKGNHLTNDLLFSPSGVTTDSVPESFAGGRAHASHHWPYRSCFSVPIKPRHSTMLGSNPSPEAKRGYHAPFGRHRHGIAHRRPAQITDAAGAVQRDSFRSPAVHRARARSSRRSPCTSTMLNQSPAVICESLA